MANYHSGVIGLLVVVAASGCSHDEVVRSIEQGLCVSHPEDPCCPGSPIILDLEGNGFDLTNLAGGVPFKLSPASVEQVSWTAPGSDDAWLALDRNGNGVIDDGSELFGNFTPQPESTSPEGYAALAAYDLNHDGVIDARDKVFNDLLLWQDRNHDGVSDPDELSTLADHGITALGIQFTGHRWTDDGGNLFRYSARVEHAAGSHVGPVSYDVFLITGRLEEQARKQGALQSDGEISLGDIQPQPHCGGGGGGGGGGPSCQFVMAPAGTCQGGAALCVLCTSNNTSCEKVCDGFIGFDNMPKCLVCNDGTCSPGTAADASTFNCTSFIG